MNIFKQFLDVIGFSKRSGELITETGEVTYRRVSYDKNLDPTFTISIKTETDIILETNDSTIYGPLREKDIVTVNYWIKSNYKGEIKDYEIDSVKLNLRK